MKIIIKNQAYIQDLDYSIVLQVKKALTIQNPLFNKRMDMGLPVFGIPNQLKYYDFDPLNSHNITVPVGSLPNLLAQGIINPNPEDLIDCRKTVENEAFFSNLKFTSTLRDYQQDIVDACMSKSVGVIEAMTGSGKTMAFVDLFCERQQQTLVLVNTIELVRQTKEAFVENTNLTANDIGFIGSGKFQLKPITVGLHQTMSKLTDENWKQVNDNFGMIIADEVHICSAHTYSETMRRADAKYKFGFSATPRRSDGLTPVIHFVTGPLIHKVPIEKLKKYLVKPTLKIIETDYYFPMLFSSDYQSMISDMAMDEKRNKLIVDTLQKDYSNRNVVLLCNRKQQVADLAKLIGSDAAGLTSDTKKKERQQIVEDIKNKKIKHIVSTFALFSTGINIPHLDVLFFCSPIKSGTKIPQSAGRIMRQAAGKKTAEMVDFVDVKIEQLRIQAYSRKRMLNNLW